MGRKKRWSEDMQARFTEGTFVRIAAVLDSTEDRTEFVRIAVENELKRRERLAGNKTDDGRARAKAIKAARVTKR